MKSQNLIFLCLGVIFMGQASPPAWAKRENQARSVEEMLVKHKDPLIRESAAQILGLRGSSSAIPLLIQALKNDENKWVRARSAESLGLIGSTSAIQPLQSALNKEKDQRVRRMIGQALLRLGQRSGIDELMWQLKSGNNNSKAEAMQFLVATTGQPFGQDIDRWWNYLYDHGRVFLALRPEGSPAIRELRGLKSDQPKIPGAGPYLYAKKPQSWQQVAAIVLSFSPSPLPVTKAKLIEYEKAHGPIADGCLLLLRTRWQEAKHGNLPANNKMLSSKSSLREKAKNRPDSSTDAVAPWPWLENDAAQYLLQRAPGLLGIAIDTPTLDSPLSVEQPTRNLLVDKNRLVLESLGDMDRLQPEGTRLLIVTVGRNTANSNAAYAVQILAILP